MKSKSLSRAAAASTWMALIALGGAGCESRVTAAEDPVELSVEDPLVTLSVEAGMCATAPLTVRVSTSSVATVTASPVVATCSEPALSFVGGQVELGPSDSATFFVTYCPTAAAPCSGLIQVSAVDTLGVAGQLVQVVGTATSPDRDGDGATVSAGDCDDTDPAVVPGAVELEDGTDQDCDGIVDEGTALSDDDGDGWSERQGDCDDGNTLVHPSAPELEDGADNDCDFWVDEGTATFDDDRDGYSDYGGDCNDGNTSVHPLAHELADGIDNDCDGSIDEPDGT